MTKAIARTYSVVNDQRLRITSVVLFACMALAVFYGLNLYRVISRTVALQRVELQTAALSTTVDTLDAEYLQLSDRITPDVLAQYGLSQGQVSLYIDKTASLGMAMSGHEF